MATIALVWELGADLGHLATFLPLVRKLKAAGHRPVLILRDVTQVHVIFKDEDIEYLQAPRWMSRLSKPLPEANFTETLFHFGYLSPAGLTAVAKAWANLFTVLKPDVLLFDHAPTALIAGRLFDRPKVLFGNSFAVLPAEAPLPRYRFWEATQDVTPPMVEAENRCTANINYALQKLGAAPIAAVHELYQADYRYVTTDPLLDVYGPRDDVEHLGVVASDDIGVTPHWPAGNTPKIFVRIKPHYAHVESVLSAMTQIDARFLVYCPGLSPEFKNRYFPSNIVLSEQPYRIKDINQSCDFAVIHAGNLTEMLLRHGKPLLLLPMQMEQTMLGHKVAALNAALVFKKQDDPQTIAGLLRRLISDENIHSGAASLAKQLNKSDHTQTITIVANKICELAEKSTLS